MNDAQNGLYLREWGKVRRILRQTMTPAAADAERHALHVKALGADKSSRDFNNKDLDKILKEFRAISQPANFTTQIELEDMAAARKRHAIGHLLAALELGEPEVEILIHRRQRAGRLVTRGNAAATTFETLGEADLSRIMIDLKRQCRARWPRKGDLLTELRILRMSADLDEDHTRQAVAAALPGTALPLPALETLDYEALLIVLSVLRGLASGRPAETKATTGHIDIPF